MEPPGPERLAAAHGSLSPLQGLSSLLKPSSRGTEWSCGITAAGRAQISTGGSRNT